MSKIREDLVGVVFVNGEAGSPVALYAGDDVPDGVVVGDHLTSAPDAKRAGIKSAAAAKAATGD